MTTIFFLEDAYCSQYSGGAGKLNKNNRKGDIAFHKGLTANYLSNSYCEIWVRLGVAKYLTPKEIEEYNAELLAKKIRELYP